MTKITVSEGVFEIVIEPRGKNDPSAMCVLRVRESSESFEFNAAWLDQVMRLMEKTKVELLNSTKFSCDFNNQPKEYFFND